MDECCRGLFLPPACPIHPHTDSLCPEAYLPWLTATSDSDSELTGVSHQESMLMFVMKKHLASGFPLFSPQEEGFCCLFIFTAEGMS